MHKCMNTNFFNNIDFDSRFLKKLVELGCGKRVVNMLFVIGKGSPAELWLSNKV